MHGLEVGEQAAAQLRAAGWNARYLQGGIEGLIEHGIPTIRKRPDLGVTGEQPSRWITRERPKIDRVACPWLIRRFIDPAARVLLCADRRGVCGSDPVEGGPLRHPRRADFPRRGALQLRCPAAARSSCNSRPWTRLAAIVRGADTDRLSLAPQAAGLLAVSLGLSRLHAADDHAMLAAAMPVYDALYAWCRRRPGRNAQLARACAAGGSPMRAVSFGEALKFWLKLGFISFGGPAGQIAIMHRELVEQKRWISERRFLHALNYCMLLPGPEAQQLATYIGWLMHRTWGGIVAGALFVLPSLFILIALSWVYVAFGEVSWVAGIFYGIKPAVAAIVLQAVWRIGGRTLKSPRKVPLLWAIAVAELRRHRGAEDAFPLGGACGGR